MTDPNELWRGGSAERQACIPAPLRGLHRATLRQFLQTGAPPTAVWITGTAADLGLDAAALADLEAADLVRTADGRVTVAYPFSGTPTRQRVELDGFPGVYAMCAIDALGLPVMAGRDGQITATDPHDGAPVQVSVRGRTWTWTPPGAVVVYGRTIDCGTDCGSWEVMCPHTTFHASRDSAQAYLAARPGIDGEILGQQAAIDLGRRIFGPLLSAGGTHTARPERLRAGRSSTVHLPDNSTTFA
jgi:alkylmercury lyase